MKALISPNEQVVQAELVTVINDDNVSYQTSSWDVIPNGARIADIVENEFEVASPLFWVECNASINTSDYYYDTSDNTIKQKNNFEEPIIPDGVL